MMKMILPIAVIRIEVIRTEVFRSNLTAGLQPASQWLRSPETAERLNALAKPNKLSL